MVSLVISSYCDYYYPNVDAGIEKCVKLLMEPNVNTYFGGVDLIRPFR